MSPTGTARKWLHITPRRLGRHGPHQETVACHRIVTGDIAEHPQTYESGGRTYAFDAWWHDGPVYVLEHGHWVPSGTLRVQNIGFTHSADLALTWGTFSLRGGGFGDVDGTWTWDYGHERDGFGAGDGADGRHVTMTFLASPPDHLPPAPPAPGSDDDDAIYLLLTR